MRTPLKFLTDPAEIHAWLNTHTKTTGTVAIDDQGRVSVSDSISIKDPELTVLPIQFHHVGKTFSLECPKLTSFEGSPPTCERFYVMEGEVTTLVGGPTNVQSYHVQYCHHLLTLEGAPIAVEDFICMECSSLSSLEGAPATRGVFNCSHDYSLKNLKGAPNVCKTFNAAHCINLTSLEGAPEIVYEDFIVSTTAITDLQHSPRQVGIYHCKNCAELASFKGLTTKIIGHTWDPGYLICSYCPKLMDFSGMGETSVAAIFMDGSTPLRSLQGMPATVNFLRVGGRQIMHLLPLPPGLKHLEIRKLNKLTAVEFRAYTQQGVTLEPQLANKAKWLTLYNQMLTPEGDYIQQQLDFERLYHEPFFNTGITCVAEPKQDFVL